MATGIFIITSFAPNPLPAQPQFVQVYGSSTTLGFTAISVGLSGGATTSPPLDPTWSIGAIYASQSEFNTLITNLKRMGTGTVKLTITYTVNIDGTIVVTDIQSVRQLFQLQALELKIAASTLVINAETKLLNELVKELLSAAIEAERRVPERSGYPGAIDETEDVA